MEATKRCSACFTEIDQRAVRCPKCHSRQADAPAFHRGTSGRIIGGVCAGLASYFAADVSLVRVAVAFATLISGGLVCSAYLLLWLLSPPAPDGAAPIARFASALKRLFAPSRDAVAPTTNG
jgi:phage shock protein PspC (stress-responsive transcriptional regulator)